MSSLNNPETTALLEEGTHEARNKLIEMYHRSVYYWASNKRPNGLQFEEAISIASLALVLAVDGYMQKPQKCNLLTYILNKMTWIALREMQTTITKNNKTFCYDDVSEDFLECYLTNEEYIEAILTRKQIIKEVRNTLDRLAIKHPQASLYLKRHYGIMCEPKPIKELAKEDGISYNTLTTKFFKYRILFKQEWLKLNDVEEC